MAHIGATTRRGCHGWRCVLIGVMSLSVVAGVQAAAPGDAIDLASRATEILSATGIKGGLQTA